MKYYPICIDIAGKSCVVIGGGEVAERKVYGLLDSGGSVTVISPKTTKNLKKLADGGVITLVSKGYKTGMLKGATIVISATDVKKINEAAYKEALSLGLPFNVVDSPDKCTFIVPSVVKRGDLVIAISTSGAFPALSKKLREELEEIYGSEYALFVRIIGLVRKKLLKGRAGCGKKERVFKGLLDSAMPEMIRRGAWDEVDKLLTRICSPAYTLSALGVDVKGPAKAK